MAKFHKKAKAIEFLLFGVLLVVALGVSQITGNVSASGGQTTDAGNTVITNPNFGAVKGTVQFVIKDGGTVISTEKGANYRLYFSRNGQPVANYSLVKSQSGSYDGSLTGIDADSGSTCSAASYTTELMYYDENNDGTKQPSEKDVYSIVADSNGCFASKLPNGAWDIYG